MANKEIRLKIDVIGNAEGSLKNIQKSYDDIAKAAETAKKATQGVGGPSASNPTPTTGADMNPQQGGKYLKKAFRTDKEEMIGLAVAGDKTSESFREAQEKAARFKDEMDEVNNRIKYFSQSSGEKAAQGLSESINLIGASAQVAVGSMTLLGMSNEEATKTVAKLASIEAVMNGVKQVTLALQSDSIFMLGLENAKLKVLALTQGAYTAVVGTSTGALKAFRLALAGTGIGLAIVAVGYLTQAWIDSSDATEKALKVEKDIDEQRSINAKNAEEYSKRMVDTERKMTLDIMRAKGQNKEADALEKSWQETSFANLIKAYNQQKKIVDVKRDNWNEEQRIIKEREEQIKKPEALTIGGQGYLDQYKKQTELLKQESKNSLKELNEETKILNAAATGVNITGKTNELSRLNRKDKVDKNTISKPQTLSAVKDNEIKRLTDICLKLAEHKEVVITK